MKTKILVFSFVLFISIGAGFPRPSSAQTSPIDGESKVAGKIESDFANFLKNTDGNLVMALRNGGEWNYTTTTTDANGVTTQSTKAVDFSTVKSGKMGWGELKIALALAQSQYDYSPTSQELHTTLMGDENTQGILQMRADGMGWGEIAHHYDLKLGEVMRGVNSKNPTFTADTTSTTDKGVVSTSGNPTDSEGSSIVTGSGKTIPGQAKGLSATGKGMSGQGIVTGSGKAVGSSVSQGIHSGRGIVTGSGRSVGGSTSGIVSGRGHAYGVVGGGHGSGGGGHGKGRNK